jgi:predicted HicB family RNase H-like nuclease
MTDLGRPDLVGYLQVRDVPDDLHREARVLATERGESLRALVIRALEREVDRLRGERPKRDRRR